LSAPDITTAADRASKLRSLRSVFVEIWAMFDRRMKVQACGLVTMMLLVGAIEGLGIGLVLPLFSVIGDPDSITTIEWLAQLHDFAGQPTYGNFIIMIFAGVFALFVIKNLLVYLNLFLQTRWVWRNGARTMCALVENYVHMPYAIYLRRNSNELLRNVTSSVTQIFQGTLIPALNILAELIVVVAIVAVLMLARPREALIVATVLTLPTLVFLQLSKSYLGAWGRRAHDLHFRNLSALNHAFGAIKEIKVLGKGDNVVAAYRDIPFQVAAVNEKTILTNGAPRILLEVLTIGGLLAVAAAIVARGGALASILPTLGLFAAAAFRLLPSANRIVSMLNSINFALAAVQEVQRDLRLTDTELPPKKGANSRGEIGNFFIDDVAFTYDGTDRHALRGITLRIHKGQSIALVGPSGAGKTTLANILLGLLTPTAGRILVGETDITTDPGVLRGRVGLVPQDTFLVDDSLRANIAFAVPPGEVDAERVALAARMAHLDELVRSLPNGLDTVLGERGIRLSGGQRQRVVIARALYNDPEILVFDEATSALDAESEAAITDAIERLSGKKTLIIIAHRLSTVKNCDCLHWMENGRIVDSGRFDELVVRNAAFAKMVSLLDLSQQRPSRASVVGIP
jgi:ATP-binding cassette subfamily C protein